MSVRNQKKTGYGEGGWHLEVSVGEGAEEVVHLEHPAFGRLVPQPGFGISPPPLTIPHTRGGGGGVPGDPKK